MYKTNSLTPTARRIIRNKKTEDPSTGIYNRFEGKGTYCCRQCGLALFRSDHKFLSTCGWPSFDDEIPGTLKRLPDTDGQRTEIVCQRCDGHLGHVFQGEHLTEKNLRHCVNSESIDFANSLTVNDTEEAIFAGGCFWGLQTLFDGLGGVIKTEVGYCGGELENPDYENVCKKQTGHLESLRVLFDTRLTNYEILAKFFFEIHDSTQTNGQGPDLGPQYLSGLFYYNDTQKQIATQLIEQLAAKGLKSATQLHPASTFWPAEDIHQDYYRKTGKAPYCHRWQAKF